MAQGGAGLEKPHFWELDQGSRCGGPGHITSRRTLHIGTFLPSPHPGLQCWGQAQRVAEEEFVQEIPGGFIVCQGGRNKLRAGQD